MPWDLDAYMFGQAIGNMLFLYIFSKFTRYVHETYFYNSDGEYMITGRYDKALKDKK